jgi:hypothetical protein
MWDSASEESQNIGGRHSRGNMSIKSTMSTQVRPEVSKYIEKHATCYNLRQALPTFSIITQLH